MYLAELAVLPFLRCGLFLAAAIGAWAGPGASAFAQEPQRGVTVSERPRPAYDSAGIRAGGFRLYPSIELGLRRELNVYRTASAERSDSVWSVRPRIAAVSQWSNHSLVLDAGAEQDTYRVHEDEGSTDWFVNASGRLDVRRDTGIEAAVGVERLHEDRGDPNATAIARPARYLRSSANAHASHRFNRLSLEVGGGATHLAHRTRSQADRDRLESELTVRAGYRLAPEVEAFARATGRARDYEERQGRFDRDSEGWELVAGTGLDLGGIITGDVFAGYLRQDYADRALPLVEGAALGGSLAWNVTALTTVSAGVRRGVEESVLEASGYIATRAEAGIDYEMLRNVVLSANAGFTRHDYEATHAGSERRDDMADVAWGALWLLGRNSRVDVAYRIQRRLSTVPENDYEARTVSVNLRLHF